MQTKLIQVDGRLETQHHDPKLIYVYIFLSVWLSLQVLGFFIVHFLKNRIVNWFLHNQERTPWLSRQNGAYMPIPPTQLVACCSPPLDRARSVGITNPIAMPEMAQTNWMTAGVMSTNSPGMGERSKRQNLHPVTSL